MPKKLTTQDFIKKSKEIHGNKYDYSKVEYTDSSNKVCIICPVHGEFWQKPYSHLNGRGCQRCGNENKGKNKKLTQDEFIKKSKLIHGDKYDYSKVEYVNSNTKVCIICPKHGEFWQKPIYHTFNKCSCPKCAIENNKGNSLSKEIFLGRAIEIHGNKYDYSKVEYTNGQTKVCIICPEHGEFWQTLDNHINQKQGCPKCGIEKRSEKRKFTKEEFVKKARKIHGNKYDYSKVEYVNNKTRVCIICPEHGEFWQTPCRHLQGNGCQKCTSSNNENRIRVILESKNIVYVQEKTFDWLIYNKHMFLDFFLPDYNIAIEYQGIQHFKPVDFSGLGENYSINVLKKQKERDKVKKELCNNHNINIYYVMYNENVEEKVLKIIENAATDKKTY